MPLKKSRFFVGILSILVIGSAHGEMPVTQSTLADTTKSNSAEAQGQRGFGHGRNGAAVIKVKNTVIVNEDRAPIDEVSPLSKVFPNLSTTEPDSRQEILKQLLRCYRAVESGYRNEDLRFIEPGSSMKVITEKGKAFISANLVILRSIKSKNSYDKPSYQVALQNVKIPFSGDDKELIYIAQSPKIGGVKADVKYTDDGKLDRESLFKNQEFAHRLFFSANAKHYDEPEVDVTKTDRFTEHANSIISFLVGPIRNRDEGRLTKWCPQTLLDYANHH